MSTAKVKKGTQNSWITISSLLPCCNACSNFSFTSSSVGCGSAVVLSLRCASRMSRTMLSRSSCMTWPVSYTHLDVYKRQAQIIATITRQQIGTVERALQIFLKLGLVEVLDSGTFYMSNIELLIGQSSTEAERKRAARLQNKALSALRTSGGHLSDIRPPEIEIELEKEIKIKREIEKVRPEMGHPSHTYGRYQNIFLTDEELADLQASFPAVWEQYIEKLSEYMASTGKRYQSHVATIRRWAGEDAKKTITPSRNRDYSVKEDETV